MASYYGRKNAELESRSALHWPYYLCQVKWYSWVKFSYLQYMSNVSCPASSEAKKMYIFLKLLNVRIYKYDFDKWQLLKHYFLMSFSSC